MGDAEKESAVAIFCRQVGARSLELQEAMHLVAGRGLTSVEVGLLRQELDSMVRVMFLLAQGNRERRTELIEASINGQRWRLPTSSGKSALVTDRELVELADTFTGWAGNVYRFGCAYIHLSDLHDHEARDPFRALPIGDREEIARHLNQYHGARLSAESTFVEVVYWVPNVMDKISTNLASYVKQLADEGDLRL